MDINSVIIVGRLTRDAETKYTTSGQAICKFSLAVNRSRKVGDKWEDEASFFDIVVFGKRAETLSQRLLKGKQVGIAGELKQDRWQQDGQSRSKIEIVAHNVQLFGSNSQSGGQDNGSYNDSYDGIPF